MGRVTKRVVVLGGGTAGWLTAGVIAAEYRTGDKSGLDVLLVESPDIPTIGVGEGTWPTMRNTLRKIGISETQLFRECDASFKQGAKFCGWVNGAEDDFYYHPLTVPEGYGEVDFAAMWCEEGTAETFSDRVNYQSHLCERGLAPKLITTPEYTAIANYAYHIDAVKLGKILASHCVEVLGVDHHRTKITGIRSHEDGDILSLLKEDGGEIFGDLFIDCSGVSSRLIGEHYNIPLISCGDQLFNDRAIATQIPYTYESEPIASHTISTAQTAGWIWDIGLSSRKGAGHVYSSAHINDESALVELHAYLERSLSEREISRLNFRKLKFSPGYRAKFWHRNCVAVGMAAGFVEPLEASALVLVEQAAEMISTDFPAHRAVMDIVAERFNCRFKYRWSSIIDFLKLHYVITRREDTQYWRDHTCVDTVSTRLSDWLKLWAAQPPCKYDFPHIDEVFSSASWQYVLYGMGFETEYRSIKSRSYNSIAYQNYISSNKEFVEQCVACLPSNRELIDKIKHYGLQQV